MPLPKEEAWFAAKRYGWGWGFPLRWQGWVSLLIYIVALIAGVRFLVPHTEAVFVYVAVITIALLALCFWKGETPKWRWGDDV